MNTDLRMMALDSVLEYDRTGQKLDAVIHQKLKENPSLLPTQKKFYVRLTTGAVENIYRLDYCIGACSNTPVKKIRPALLWILRLAVYQITDMDGVPHSAAVNEAVKMAQKKGFGRLKGFVNAVLRTLIREPKRYEMPGKEKPAEYLSVRYSQPVYLVKKWIGVYGFEATEKICASFLTEKPLAVHIKCTGNDPETTLKQLENEGITAINAPWPDGAYFLSGFSDIPSIRAFREGKFFIQDISSQLAVFAAGIKSGDRILDVCAAPGGKSLLAADLLNGTGHVTARDISKARIKKLEENIERTGFSNITAEVMDAAADDAASHGLYDIVLVDAPCSGYGVIGRKPDIKYSASREKEEELSKIQRKILHTASSYVKPGGTLVYSTCTISSVENEENAAWFLKEHDFSPVSLQERLGSGLNCEGNHCQILPDETHDGFFIAVFRNNTKGGKKEPSSLCEKEPSRLRHDLGSMYIDELKTALEELGEKPFRAGQLFSWIHEKRAVSYDEMTDLSKTLREKLKKEYPLPTLATVERLVSEKDGTEKFLFALSDGNIIESVLMKYDYGYSVCVSSQVGCAMGCAFCASTIKGLERNLKASEMLGQVYAIDAVSKERVSHVVIMGMGEPLANYDAVVRFIRLLCDPKGYGLSRRNITISTCGLVPEIKKLAAEDLPVTLAVSLHAATDEKRKKIMPVAKRYCLRELMDAARYYFEKTGRRVSFEYALIEGVNDSDEDAEAIASLIGGFPSHVNLIPVNNVTESGLARPAYAIVQEFYKKLEKYGINVTIRKEMGSDINGACGQLRNSYLK